MNKYILKYTITNNKKGLYEFTTYENAKKIYLALAENITIKSAKIYEIKGKKNRLIEKFSKKNILTIKGVE